MKKKTNVEWLAGTGVPIDACLERIAARVVEWAGQTVSEVVRGMSFVLSQH